MQTATLEVRNRQLVIVPDQWVAFYDEPKEYRWIWPTNIPARDDDTRNGIHGILHGELFSATTLNTRIYLPDGGATKAIDREERTVKMPRKNARYNWEWRYGSWVKDYKC